MQGIFCLEKSAEKKRINHCDTVLYFYNCVQGFKFQKLLKGCLKKITTMTFSTNNLYHLRYDFCTKLLMI